MVLVAAALLSLAAVFADWWIAMPDSAAPRYVGGGTCVECHAEQAEAWAGSHHDMAMRVADPETVLGDFNDAELVHHGMTSRMFRRDGKFMVHTEGPDGKPADFEVKYTFGFDPLQQYLVEFDAPDDRDGNTVGRLQTLRVSWDTKARRWFYLAPPDVSEKLAPTDDLHWTGIAQRWNNMCADCHSTNLRKNYDPDSGTYRTTFTDINVGCEACHGPGSAHVELARATSLFWDRKRGYGLPSIGGSDSRAEIETCGPCHSRRRVLDPDFRGGRGYFDHFGTELPTDATYFADGQILDEVYVMGSFLQSKMYHRGIRCSDCHDPHSARLKHEGNAVCTSCHQHPAAKYDSPSHHHHRPGSPGASCVECHMPETTYMDVDPRRDHSLRIPRPDLSVAHGLPNACSRCHVRFGAEHQGVPETAESLAPSEANRPYRDLVIAARTDASTRSGLRAVDAWCASATRAWFPRRTGELRHFGERLAPAWRGEPDARDGVLEVCRQMNYPAILRAAGWQWISQFPSESTLDAARDAVRDADPLVRAAAVRVVESWIPAREDLDGMAPEQRAAVAEDVAKRIGPFLVCLDDPVRLVRIDAAAALSHVPGELLPAVTTGPQREKLARAKGELRASLQLNNDRAGAHVALGVLREQEGDVEQAAEAYRRAIRVEPRAAGPRSNLAALREREAAALRSRPRQAAAMGDQRAAEQMSADLAARDQEIADLRREELELLRRDAGLAPEHAEIQYRFGLALYLNNALPEAAAVLRRAQELDPRSPRYLLTLALLHQKLEQFDEAIGYANRLIELVPNDPGHRQLLDTLRRQRETARPR